MLQELNQEKDGSNSQNSAIDSRSTTNTPEENPTKENKPKAKQDDLVIVDEGDGDSVESDRNYDGVQEDNFGTYSHD